MNKFAALANCSICTKAPGTGNGECPFKKTWFEQRKELERHECVSFKPVGNKGMEKRRAKAMAADVVQDSLF
jgi:hypothetical protein